MSYISDFVEWLVAIPKDTWTAVGATGAAIGGAASVAYHGITKGRAAETPIAAGAPATSPASIIGGGFAAGLADMSSVREVAEQLKLLVAATASMSDSLKRVCDMLQDREDDREADERMELRMYREKMTGREAAPGRSGRRKTDGEG